MQATNQPQAEYDMPMTTFNLGFVISLSDEEIELNPDDTTAAMFMW